MYWSNFYWMIINWSNWIGQLHMFDGYSNKCSITCQKSWFIFTPWIHFFSKVNFHTSIQANVHFTNVFLLMNGAERGLVVWYFLVISLQYAVNDVFEFFTILIKSHPISSPAQVLLDKKNTESWSPLYSKWHWLLRHFLKNTSQLIHPCKIYIAKIITIKVV